MYDVVLEMLADRSEEGGAVAVVDMLVVVVAVVDAVVGAAVYADVVVFVAVVGAVAAIGPVVAVLVLALALALVVVAAFAAAAVIVVANIFNVIRTFKRGALQNSATGSCCHAGKNRDNIICFHHLRTKKSKSKPLIG